jgi:hypothetical protein
VRPVALATTLAPDPTRLPEDPVAGKASEQQWREHMVAEERERQMMFDRERLKQHRALAKLIAAARARYDRAKSVAAVDKLRAQMQQSVSDMRARVTEIDHWGVNSRLLGDYDALASSLGSGYAEAKLAALHGDTRPLAEARAAFDQHMHAIATWLEEVEKGEDE